jgi:hypothetical protein
MVLRREYRNLEPVRYPIEPLSLEENSADTTGSGTQSDGEDIDVIREVDVTLVNPQGTDERHVDETEGLEVEVATHLDPDDMRCLENDSSLEEEVLGLEQLFALTQHKLEEAQDLLMVNVDEDAVSGGQVEGEVEEDPDTETKPLKVLLNGNSRTTDDRQHNCPKESRPIRGWLAKIYVEDEIFLMTIDTGSTMIDTTMIDTMIDTKAYFKRFLYARLKPP